MLIRLCLFHVFLLSIPAINTINVKYNAKIHNQLLLTIVIFSIFNFIRIATAKNIVPDGASKIKYLGLIFSLQYLHFPPKNI